MAVLLCGYIVTSYFCPSCKPSHLSCNSILEIMFGRLGIYNIAKDRYFTLHKSNIDLCLPPLFHEEDLELQGLYENASTSKARVTSFGSSMEIYSPSSSSSRGWGTYRMTFFFFNLSMLEERLNRVRPETSMDDLRTRAKEVTIVLEEEPSPFFFFNAQRSIPTKD